jgi:methionyl-tRNA formyltransferase
MITTFGEQPKLKFVIAGSTSRTVLCAQALIHDPRFECVGVLTPEPKSIGRKKILTKNPVHELADEHELTGFFIKTSIDDTIQSGVEKLQGEIDLLVVVDFGYIVPNWLLDLPKIAPINVHPSLLPSWRGSSPAQFAILYGEKKSGVTIQRMVQLLDEGPIIAQLPFAVGENWTQEDYYHHSFELVVPKLADVLFEYAGSVWSGAPKETVQDESPTPMASRLSKDDSFVDWRLLEKLIVPHDLELDLATSSWVSPTVALAQKVTGASNAEVIERSVRAFYPWPAVWTIVPTESGEKRMKILQAKISTNLGDETKQFLQLEEVQLEGQRSSPWSQVKNQLRGGLFPVSGHTRSS